MEVFVNKINCLEANRENTTITSRFLPLLSILLKVNYKFVIQHGVRKYTCTHRMANQQGCNSEIQFKFSQISGLKQSIIPFM